jgi:tRNA (adenine37-N6)-methyltransferase
METLRVSERLSRPRMLPGWLRLWSDAKDCNQELSVQDISMITLAPIGFVRCDRQALTDDDWGQLMSRIELVDSLPSDCLLGLETFSHAEVIFHFHRVEETAIERGARHPRENTEWPRVGIFAQRGKNRPNRLGSTIVEILQREERALLVRGLDAVDETPVLDIKPVMTEFLPRTPIRQPAWSRELMQNYWKSTPERK